ncbi:hypothetical protein BGW36DRAFT_391211 [Talaromyces proteolyticus]|uniref:Uncharacterized protein n=1 Tax=Talaromyces proteolyticus TaxID=1131652 RepID=A0AAD4PST7_9EURO|nr:uncharacterized protein BGW36DRAFT_391211 [Talaromyces proteolyticus]KAH8689608.1 hypothetical protein BGW36DRAFT_391211 [Talaromyces proteolyticus]
MGFLQMISADELSAVYHVNEGQLVLNAEGKTQDFTTGITFIRQPFPGGLKFNLEGWVGPLNGKTSTYNKTQGFDIAPPIPKEVVIVTANYPNGKLVPVEITPSGTGVALVSKEGRSTAGPSDTNIVVPETETITARIRTPFKVKQSKNIGSSQLGDISVNYDDQYVLLKNASIQGSDIVWTFDPVKIGVTEVVVFVMGTVQNFVLRIPYKVVIFDAKTQPVSTVNH